MKGFLKEVFNLNNMKNSLMMAGFIDEPDINILHQLSSNKNKDFEHEKAKKIA